MYALAFLDVSGRRLLLARDPLGIKPLYYWINRRTAGDEVVFANELCAFAGHPGFSPRADAPVVSAYLTTLRTTLNDRTLFAGVSCVRPGEALVFDLSGPALRIERCSIPAQPVEPGDARAAVESSVRAHLRSDVPICCLLSGGLDSTIIASLASREFSGLRTYAAGAPSPDAAPWADDLDSARRVAASIRSLHTEAPVTRELFAERWPDLVRRSGQPLSTPNEIAINEVARRLRADGVVVALSGEGADELWAGYDAVLNGAHAWHRDRPPGPWNAGVIAAAAHFELDQAAWIPIDSKPSILAEPIWRGIEHDAALLASYESLMADSVAECAGQSILRPHLRLRAKVNLPGLLARLDSATMLEGVEGRTPFADVLVAAAAAALPFDALFTANAGVTGTKIALRRSFGDLVPPQVFTRPKASFPLPFEDWLEDNAAALLAPGPIHDLIRPDALRAVAARPRELSRAAWPLINLALWTRRWWG